MNNKLTKHPSVVLKLLPIISAVLLRELNRCLDDNGSGVKNEKLKLW